MSRWYGQPTCDDRVKRLVPRGRPCDNARMADQRQQTSPPSTRRSPGQRAPGQPPTPPSWRVTPAPDGRGRQQQPQPPRGPSARWLLLLLAVGLLALNLYISSQALQPAARVSVTFTSFWNQLESGNVKSISS